MMSCRSQEQIHEANIRSGKTEARYYDAMRLEIFNDKEQRRLMAVLATVDKLVDDNRKRALDFGAGTGNLTGKLLDMGYRVTAVDISREMCSVLRRRYAAFEERKTLTIVNAKIEDLTFPEQFDLIACYSVLHHLPDYASVIRRLAVLLKSGGVMYLDHEWSPFWWDTSRRPYSLMRRLYELSNFAVSSLLSNAFLTVLIVPRIVDILRGRAATRDEVGSDYWCDKMHHIDHCQIGRVFEEASFSFFVRQDYQLDRSGVFNPLSHICERVCGPDMSLWMAKK